MRQRGDELLASRRTRSARAPDRAADRSAGGSTRPRRRAARGCRSTAGTRCARGAASRERVRARPRGSGRPGCRSSSRRPRRAPRRRAGAARRGGRAGTAAGRSRRRCSRCAHERRDYPGTGGDEVDVPAAHASAAAGPAPGSRPPRAPRRAPRRRGAAPASTSPRSYGTRSSSTCSSARSRSPIDARELARPPRRSAPDTAERSRDATRASWSSVSSSTVSDFVNTMLLGHLGRADLAEHRPHRLDPVLGLGRARRRRGARAGRRSPTSSSVERNDSTSWCGRRRTNPTVSDSSTISPPGSRSRRVLGSRVENSRSSTRTSAWVSRFSSVDFPAFV